MDLHSDHSFRLLTPFIPDGGANKGVGQRPLLKHRDLVAAAQAGSHGAFDDLWALYSRRIFRTALGITRNPHDAEDAVQDAFMRAFLAIGSFESRANFYTWLTRIAINSALGILRKRRSRPEEVSIVFSPSGEGDGVDEGARDLAPDPERVYAEQEEREKLMCAIGKLPGHLRIVTRAVITEDCSVKDVACRLNISVPAVKSRLYRARIMLRALTASPHVVGVSHRRMVANEAPARKVISASSCKSMEPVKGCSNTVAFVRQEGSTRYVQIVSSDRCGSSDCAGRQWGAPCTGERETNGTASLL
ncbi:RNA polymerase sigma factor, sigma-70 family [Bryocella elongata]|uniref:RNA polymerase sigma factor, sigma-70 family n=1 Tax=Bryocella elongata TaxID=863522 RepID=A0A1H5UWK8_9BACT|nr:sigma-70 family RNA polymerase sigma factor [Bryocella elongata]SEF79459.1 RNA polymerase sigma factor, sigma-70 family [Bryocella elongata]